MVVLRLARVGKKNHPTFRLIASDKRKDTLGSYLELLGSYDPNSAPAKVQVNSERVKYWLSVGAKPSATVHNLLVEQGIMSGPKMVVAKAKAEPATEAPAAPAPAAT